MDSQKQFDRVERAIKRYNLESENPDSFLESEDAE